MSPDRSANGVSPGVNAERRLLDADARGAAGGFTYIAVLVLIALVGMGLVLASELWLTAQKREKERELLFTGNQFRRAIEMYSATGAYPKRLEDLLQDPRVPGVRRYLRKIYRDPITGSNEWGLVRSSGDVIIGVYSLSDERPLKQAEFRLVDQDFKGKKKYSEWVFLPKSAQPGPKVTTASDSGAAQNAAAPIKTQPRVRR